MRLIDADKLVEICRKGWKLFGREDEKLKHWVDENDIREQPTVEAIPVKWINMWLLKKVFIWEATTMANETNRLQAIENIKYGFETMLKDWENENEMR